MLNASHPSVLASLQEMLVFCQKIHDLLKLDGDYFAKDDFRQIEESNAKKMELLTELNEIVTKLSTIYPKGIIEQIKTQCAAHPEQSELRMIAEQLHAEIKNCNKYIAINSSMVFNNLQMLKEIWDKLVMLKSENATYDLSGKISNK